ncbi:MAG: hypothetical protein M1830_005474, partial [Pleopsidium flavum]
MDSAHELESFKFVRRDDPPDIGIEARSPLDRDRYDLARLGKKQVLKVRAMSRFGLDTNKLMYLPQRNFGLMSMLGFSCTVMTTWEGIPVLFGGALL